METTILFPADHDAISESDRGGLHPFSAFNSDTYRRRQLALIVAAADKDGAIGRDGGMIWHIPADLRHFKNLTMGHAIIMGRLTWESLPKGALPGRRNIIISRDPDFSAVGAETVGSLEEAVALCDNDTMPFVIGGGQIYRLALPYASHLFLTRIMADPGEADTFFPMPDADWRLVEESDLESTPAGVEYKFQTYRRR